MIPLLCTSQDTEIKRFQLFMTSFHCCWGANFITIGKVQTRITQLRDFQDAPKIFYQTSVVNFEIDTFQHFNGRQAVYGLFTLADLCGDIFPSFLGEIIKKWCN